MSTNKFEVTPCQQCLSDLERKAVRSAAEDIQAERRNADQQFKEGYKEGFKEGFIKAHDLINS